MADDKFQVGVDGAEVSMSDLNNAFSVGALAEDRVLAELLRLTPNLGGGVSKAILPFSVALADPAQNTLRASASANGKITVMPFRAIVGSRTLIATDARENWRDIRSGLFVGGSGANIFAELTITPNASGSARWDTVYATLSLDVDQPLVVRKRKGTTTSTVATTTMINCKKQTVVVSALAGTPGVTSPPNVPPDTSSSYNILLGYVRVPNGHGSGSSVADSQIREAAPVVSFATAMGAQTMRPATLQDESLASTEYTSTWFGGTRPETFAPRTHVGAIARYAMIDLETPLSVNGSSFDFGTVDWRKRYFRVTWEAQSGVVFASSNPGTPALAFPKGGTAFVTMGQSFVLDASLVASSSTICTVTPAQLPAMAGGTSVGLYVSSGGILRLFVSGAPACRFFVWLEATSQMPNA